MSNGVYIIRATLLGQMLLLFCLIALCFSNQFAHATIRILYSDANFTQVLESERANGTSGETALLLINSLSASTQFEFIPLARHESLLKQQNESVCALFKLRTPERKAYSLFSRPIAFQTANRLFMNSRLAEPPKNLFNRRGELKSLKALIERYPESTLVLTKNASSGEYLDREIRKIAPSQVSFVQSMSDHSVNMRMFANSRADFTIAFPSQVLLYQNDMTGMRYRSYSIEGVPPVLSSHIQCNDTEASVAFLREVNKLMQDLYESEAYLNAHTKYQPQEEHGILQQEISLAAMRMSSY